MDCIRLLNFRSLVDTGPIAIKRITLLVGANSTGKSSFLRAFPLLRQSVETPTDSPFLWFGRYVDFGSIDTVTNVGSAERTVSLEFSLTVAPAPPMSAGEAFRVLDATPVSVRITLAKRKRGEGTRISSYDLTINGTEKVHVGFSEIGVVEQYTVNQFDATTLVAGWRLRGSAYILPSFYPGHPEGLQRSVLYQAFPVGAAAMRGWRWRVAHNYLLTTIEDELRPLFHGNTKEETIHQVCEQLRIGSPSALLALLPTLPGGPTWVANVNKLRVDSPRMKRLVDRILANSVPDLLSTLDDLIGRFAASITYMGPLRATAQRYYRAQDLAVSEVDFRGENLAMFLRSLSPREQHRFTQFARSHFGFSAQSSFESGHVALTLRQSDSDSDSDVPTFNLADMGFGYSQVLPVVAQVWSAFGRTADRSTPKFSLVAIEQPELHLHPAYHITLADMFAGAVKTAADANRDLRLVVETHSETIINRIGQLVRSEKLDADDVQVLVFEHEKEHSRTKINTATFDSDGTLKNWPFGFFSPAIE